MTKTTTLNAYRISNNVSGLDLGLFVGRSEDDALDAFARDAGYDDYASIPAECSAAGLVVEEVR